MTLAVRRTLRSLAAAALFAAAAGATALGQIPQALIDHKPSIATTKHTGVFGGQTIAYTAIVEEHILDGPNGTPNAFLVTIAYVRDSIANEAKRPVSFVFNGGPGASSSPLHFNGIGPRLGTRDGNVENPNSLLDATDLVFIDPVGTGFSRPYTTDIGKQFYWNLTGDAASVAKVIGEWLREHHREGSPRYLIGESYGTTRIGEILRSHKELAIDGVVLISAVGGSENAGDLRYIKNVPSMAVAAWYHERVPRNGRSVDQVWADAVAFVEQEYRPALARGSSLSAEQRKAVAAKLSALVGLPARFIEEKNLRLSAQDWLLNVLKDKGLRVSNQDTRVTGPLVLSAEQAASSSPADGLGGTRIGTAMQAPALVPNVDAASTSPRSALESYLVQDLEFKTLESYRSLNLDINGFWDRAGVTTYEAAPGVAEGMRANPKMRMFWIQGYFDLNTPAYGALDSYARAGLTGDRVTGTMAPGPHTVFATEESRRFLATELRRWLK